MEPVKRYENYPALTVILSGIHSLAVYALGFFIIFELGLFYSVLYAVYILFLEYRLLKNRCTKCFYWGKTCGFGRGRISSWFFKKGDISEFCAKEMKWRDMTPDILVSLIPLVVGIILLVLKFNFILLSAFILLLALTTVGNGFVRRSLTCKYCKQHELGCPADLLFNKGK